MTEGSQEQLLDPACQNHGITCPRAEDNITARDVGLNVAKAGGSESSGKRLHLDQLITADINAPQKGYVFAVPRHRRIIYGLRYIWPAPRNEPHLSAGRLGPFFTAAVSFANYGREIFNGFTPVAGKT